MRVSWHTKEALKEERAFRKLSVGLATKIEARTLLADGWERVGEGGGLLWQIYRGGRVGQRITAVKIAPGGMGLLVKIEPSP